MGPNICNFLIIIRSHVITSPYVSLASQPYFSACACALGRGRAQVWRGEREKYISPRGVYPLILHVWRGEREKCISPRGVHPFILHVWWGEREKYISPRGVHPFILHVWWGEREKYISLYPISCLLYREQKCTCIMGTAFA